MKVARLHTEYGFFTAIISDPGRKFTFYVALTGFPVRKYKAKNSEIERYSIDLQYPIKKAARTMLSIGRKQGITKGAKTFLRQAKAA